MLGARTDPSPQLVSTQKKKKKKEEKKKKNVPTNLISYQE
jgi:hypothetical protein